MFDADRDLFERSRAYVESTCTPRELLAAASGVDEATLQGLEEAGGMPAATYTLFDGAIRSAIRELGEPPQQGGRAFYAPAVIAWLRRAALLDADALRTWFGESFEAALLAQAPDARVHGWARLFTTDGAVDRDALAAEVQSLNADWMNGGWAVCLRRWNGYHVVTKDLERARIGTITADGTRDTLSAAERLALQDAIESLDAVMLSFAPFERPHGTPGLYIDAMRERYAV
ncbi:DUF6058 family natural product biosynthesis protein [Terricaulis silvestris]|uniref:Uncharacterized protein n=1 Tax=Terricaulis silvestris TaxID=2686094 RepID=A0A6I6MJB8_9CAUL|nr:DUF6058 family natural product biosynthesis protein [Terricaulis silvestris]QGZ94749.1 hypothetical protein DSM104635_01579 [Terricaulis silvestris]